MVERLASPRRLADGSAGDVDYGSIGAVYRDCRVADPRIASFVHAALGDARSVLNIGAGTGSYEPTDRLVTPVEPSATMRARRPASLPTAIDAYWLDEYAPEVIDTEASRYPAISALAAGLGGVTTVSAVPIPLDCQDGFNDAYYGRPEMLLEPAARLACSAWSFVAPAAIARFEAHLAKDLADGTWDRKHGHLRSQPFLEGALVLVVSKPS
ncbi:MAG TPA: hypothetical protein VEQ58_22555 [Polyangiaceae bacterium]|nr:hypothetical protein [Polyangiaceae bacterium]